MRIQSGSPFREPVGALMHTSQFSVGTLSLARDLRSALRVARELGLHGVELDARRGLDAEQMSQTGIRQIRKWIGDEGLVVAAVAFPTRSGYGDADRLEGRIAATKAAMQLAHALGASVVTNHIGDIPPQFLPQESPKPDEQQSPPTTDPRWQLLLDVLTDLGDWGHRVGAVLCAEAGRSSPADLLRVFRALPEAAITCNLVTGSLVVHGHDPVEAVDILSSQIGHVQASDAVAGAYAGRGRAVIVGSGQVDLPGVLAALEERSYRGWIELEPVESMGARAELAEAIRSLRML
jgi:sugar phosphate isomerase/epimerase